MDRGQIGITKVIRVNIKRKNGLLTQTPACLVSSHHNYHGSSMTYYSTTSTTYDLMVLTTTSNIDEMNAYE